MTKAATDNAKANLSRLLARRVDGIFLSDFEQGEIRPDLFRHACLMVWKASYQNTKNAPTALADRRTGSRSRTENILKWTG